MIKCDACNTLRPDWFFKSVGEHYTHLNLEHVCMLCQLKPKKCFKCAVVKPGTLLYFYKHPTGLYKLTTQCKQCYIEKAKKRS